MAAVRLRCATALAAQQLPRGGGRTDVLQRLQWTRAFRYGSSSEGAAREQRLQRLERTAQSYPDDPVHVSAYLKELGQSHPEEVVRRVERGGFADDEIVTKEYIKALVRVGRFDRMRLADVVRTSQAFEEPQVASPRYSGSYGAPEPAYGGSGFQSSPAEDLYAAPASSVRRIDGQVLSGSGVAGAGGGGTGGGGNMAALRRAGPKVSDSADGIAQKFGTSHSGSPTDPVNVSLAEPSFRSQLWKSVRGLGMAFLVLAGLGTLMEDRGIGRNFGINTDVQPEPGQETPKRFEDVKGCDEAKAELEEVVHYLRSPTTFTRLGGKLPKGVLLVGPPGTGKTLLARAIAGEAGVPFFYASGSEFEEMFVGVGARRVRELFNAAKKRSPCIVFIDEIDAIGGTRNPKDQQYMKMTLNQLLVELDGFTPTDGIIVIGATNFPESLDKALVRPGRFDRHVVVSNPDVEGRTQILQLHTKDIPLAADVNLSIIARGTPGFSGAELANLSNMAALKAALDGADKVEMEHLEYAKDKIIMGAERRSAVLSEATRKLTAYHEGGHALVASYTDGALPVHKATIVPRGVSLGMVAQLPEKDMTSMTRTQMLARLDVCMGGRAAEELIFGVNDVTSGAESDFDQATRLAEAMVTRYGMSNSIGQVVYDRHSEALSTETRSLIETEVKRLMDSSYDRAKSLLRQYEGELHNLARSLLDHETLTGDEVRLAAKGELKRAKRRAIVKSKSDGGATLPAGAEDAVVGEKGIASAAAAATTKQRETVGSGAPSM